MSPRTRGRGVAVLLVLAACGCEPTVDRDEAPSTPSKSEALQSSSVSDAEVAGTWEELRKLYREEMDARLDGLGPGKRDEVVAHFADRGRAPGELAVRWTTLLRPHSDCICSLEREIQYASYALGSGWSAVTNLAAVYSDLTDDDIDPTTHRSQRPVTATEYGRTDPEHLHYAYIVDPDSSSRSRGLWHGTLLDGALDSDPDTSGGTLVHESYKPVPLHPVASDPWGAGGLAAGVGGTPLWHVWQPASGVNLSHWTKRSD